MTFRNIHVLNDSAGRVILFEIPPALRGMPVAWKGHYYGRTGESLGPLGMEKIERIRGQAIDQDWTAQVVSSATLDDLDTEAVEKAREFYALKQANRQSNEVSGWSIQTFLDRAHITQNGQITRTALLLLGKAESAWCLLPHPAQLTWKLDGQERAYKHFPVPFLLGTTRLYRCIRNTQLRVLPHDELVPIEVSRYDQKIVLEALHNCIAHQDYTRNGRVVVTELPDRLVFENTGTFFEGQPDDYVLGAKTPLRYRNPFLVQAMVELNMIDRMGYGIHDMYLRQSRRYFPMPDYDLGEAGVVKITIYGSVVDPAYSRLLMQKTDLPLADILALDRVQKKLSIPDETAIHLRKAGLIEGRKPNYFVSASVAAATDSRASYIRNRSLDNAHFARLLTEYLRQYGEATRTEINQLLLPKLSDVLTGEQKENRIANLLTNLRRGGYIQNTGSRGRPVWRLAE